MLIHCSICDVLLLNVENIDELVGCVAQLAERRSLAGELTLFYTRPAADG